MTPIKKQTNLQIENISQEIKRFFKHIEIKSNLKKKKKLFLVLYIFCTIRNASFGWCTENWGLVLLESAIIVLTLCIVSCIIKRSSIERNWFHWFSAFLQYQLRFRTYSHIQNPTAKWPPFEVHKIVSTFFIAIELTANPTYNTCISSLDI